MSEQKVTFYTRPNYTGNAHTYAVGTDENLYPGGLNDKFKSVKVSRKAKVLAWQPAAQGVVPTLGCWATLERRVIPTLRPAGHAGLTGGGIGELPDVAGAEFSSGTGSGCRQGVDVSIFGAVRPSH
ncbi:beta/gamma crystallin domain-containing protein [Streptomyces sp. NPDC054813]